MSTSTTHKILHLCVLTLILNAKRYLAQGTGSLPSTCTPKFAAIPGHTMCIEDDHGVKEYGVDATTKQAIVDYHNKVRREVSPTATDLTKVVWDDKVAEIAAKWARQCRLAHDTSDARIVPEYNTFIGQNVAMGNRNWKGAMESWFNEVSLYRFGLQPDSYLGYNGWLKIGHYSQLVQRGTQRIGCGYAKCRGSDFRRYYICNYANGQESIERPYTPGPRCSACPTYCRDGLCDCGGKYCLNGGTLNVDSCTCSCTPLYQGHDCSILNCPASDPSYCGSGYPPSYCSIYSNVPYECPFMCGICGNSPAGPPAVPTVSADNNEGPSATTAKPRDTYSTNTAETSTQTLITNTYTVGTSTEPTIPSSTFTASTAYTDTTASYSSTP